MTVLSKIDQYVSKRIARFTLLCVVLAVSFPHLFVHLTPITPALFAFMTFVSSLGATFQEMKTPLRHPLPVLAALVSLHIILPLSALLVGRVLFATQPLFTVGVILEFSVPTAIISLIWVGMERGNVPLSLTIVLLDTVLAPLLIPTTLRLLAGSVAEVDGGGMMKSLLFMIALPALAALCVNQITHESARREWQPRLSPISKICFFCIVLSNVTGVSQFFRHMTPYLLMVAGIVLMLCLFGFAIGWGMARLLHMDYPSTLTLTINIGMRNINAGAVLAMQYFPVEVLYPIVVTSLFMQVLVAFLLKLIHRTKLAQSSLSETSNLY